MDSEVPTGSPSRQSMTDAARSIADGTRRIPRRITLSRRKGWRKPAGAVVVTRPHSPFANPYPLEGYGLAESRRLYRAYLADRPEFVERIRAELAGRDLCCWCKPDAEWCHAEELLRIANSSDAITGRAQDEE